MHISWVCIDEQKSVTGATGVIFEGNEEMVDQKNLNASQWDSN